MRVRAGFAGGKWSADERWLVALVSANRLMKKLVPALIRAPRVVDVDDDLLTCSV
jgi:hypothetical protein